MAFRLTEENSRVNTWLSARTEMWHWTLCWTDENGGIHHHSGNGVTLGQVERDLKKTKEWIELTWGFDSYSS